MRGFQYLIALALVGPWPYAMAKEVDYELCNGILLPVTMAEIDLASEPSTDHTPPLDHATVIINGVSSNSWGELFWRLAKLAEETSWLSKYSPRQFDPQGDPRWPLRIFGRDLARILGFTFNDQGELLVPTAETLNARLALFNQYLISQDIAPIRVIFYPQKLPKVRTFVGNWAQRPSVPVSAGMLTHTLHDISYHYSIIVVPDPVLNLIQMEAQIFDELIAFTQYRYAESAAAENFLARFREPMIFSSQIMDALATSGNHFPEATMPDRIQNLAAQFATYTTSRSADILQQWPLMSRMTTPWNAFYHRILKYPKPADENLERLLFEFQQYTMDLHPQWHLSLSEMGLETLEGSYQLFVDRSDQLRLAASRFIHHKPD